MTDPAVVADLAPTGVLRASINLGNPVLAQGTGDEPTGVTVDLAREIAARLGVPVSFTCFDAARKSLAALIARTSRSSPSSRPGKPRCPSPLPTSSSRDVPGIRRGLRF